MNAVLINILDFIIDLISGFITLQSRRLRKKREQIQKECSKVQIIDLRANDHFYWIIIVSIFLILIFGYGKLPQKKKHTLGYNTNHMSKMQ